MMRRRSYMPMVFPEPVPSNMASTELADFEAFHAAGMVAKEEGKSEEALNKFYNADILAIVSGGENEPKRLNALNPAARALWTLGRYEEAEQALLMAHDIAIELHQPDESGMALSNLGRLAASKITQTLPVEEHAAAFSREAIPLFGTAYLDLKGHPHRYYRFANAQHGSEVAALAGDRELARHLVWEGLKVAFRRSPAPYDHERTYKISRSTRRGLGQLATAFGLVMSRNKSRRLVERARNHIR